jgi:hypothetical protein
MILRIQGDTRDIVLQKSVRTLVSRTQAVLARLFHFWVLRIVVFSRASDIGYVGIRAKAKEYSGFEGAKG